MKKRIIALLLATVLMLTVFAGCGAKKATKTDSQQSADGSVVEKGTNPFASGDIDYMSIDMPSYDVEKTDKLTFFSWRDQYGETEDPEHPSIAKVYEDATGIKVEMVYSTHSSYWSDLATLISSGNAPDLFEPNWNYYPRCMTENLAQPIDNLIDLSSPLWADVSVLTKQYMFEDKTYFSFLYYYLSDLFYYNEKMFRDAGVKTPKEYYLEDDWTWDTLQYLADEFVELGADGKAETLGFTYQGITSLAATTGVELVEYNRVNGYKFNIKNAKYTKLMNMLYDMGIAGTNSMNSVAITKMNEGQVAMAIGKEWALGYELEPLASSNELGVVLMPKMDEESEYYYPISIVPTYGITVGSKNPKAAALYIEIAKWTYLGTPMLSYLDYAPTQFNAKYPTKADFKVSDDMVEWIKELTSKDYPYIDISLWGSWLETNSFPGISEVVYNGQQWSSVVAALEPTYKTILDSYFK